MEAFFVKTCRELRDFSLSKLFSDHDVSMIAKGIHFSDKLQSYFHQGILKMLRIDLTSSPSIFPLDVYEFLRIQIK
jgi:hypothetical protein